ncbi:hypothetical protein EIP86_001788 [Pleurotus ostreatoroseus]|nr:hypothetical protein EIP86_001788 [Pleurotus ostreatoroseus]
MYSAIPRYLLSPEPDEAMVFGFDLVDEHEPPEEPWLDLPLESQILAERRTWPAVYVPVICLASGEDIAPLVASSVYQRQTWNIDLPIAELTRQKLKLCSTDSSDGLPSVTPTSDKCILLPQAIVQYKRSPDEERKALNQCRLFVEAAIEAASAMGITKFPVFTFAVHVTRAALLMGWKASNGATYIIEHNVQKFDLLHPVQAFHLATVVLRLKAREAELKKRFEEECKAYRDKLQAGIFDRWAMPEQDEDDKGKQASTQARRSSGGEVSEDDSRDGSRESENDPKTSKKPSANGPEDSESEEEGSE